MLLKLLHLKRRGPVVHLQDTDKVGNRQHPDKPGEYKCLLLTCLKMYVMQKMLKIK